MKNKCDFSLKLKARTTPAKLRTLYDHHTYLTRYSDDIGILFRTYVWMCDYLTVSSLEIHVFYLRKSISRLNIFPFKTVNSSYWKSLLYFSIQRRECSETKVESFNERSFSADIRYFNSSSLRHKTNQYNDFIPYQKIKNLFILTTLASMYMTRLVLRQSRRFVDCCNYNSKKLFL